MDGLLPMVFKSIKRIKTLRQYQHLSSPAAQATSTHEYNISDFYISENDPRGYLSRKQDQHVKFGPDNRAAHHRRCNSVHISRGYGWEESSEAGPGKAKQLVRFRSQRMFACVTGA